MELDKSSKQAGRSEAGKHAGSFVSNTVVAGSNSSNTVVAGSNSSNTAVAACSNSSINAVAANFRSISINYNIYPFPYSAALV